MKLLYIGGNAKNPVIGRLVRGKSYEVDDRLARELLRTNDWRQESKYEIRHEAKKDKKEEK